MKSYILLLLLVTDGSLGDRTFRIVNQCSQTIWMGIDAKVKETLPIDGGFEVGAGGTKEISTPDEWDAGRFWPRTGCKDENGKFTCATGNCGAEVNGFKMECKGIGGEKPVTIAEFTLHSPDGEPDFYDLSNVDGHNIAMSIKPIEGKHEKVDNPELDKYNCGAPICTFDASKCPIELVMEDGNGGKVCASICAAIHNAQQREKHDHLKKIFDDEDTRSLVCCSEDKGYNHSPYNPADTAEKKCEIEKWPRSTDDRRYDEVFKSQCPDEYSWQFNDRESTYQCKNADYEITLCPGSSEGTAPAIDADLLEPKSSDGSGSVVSAKRTKPKLTRKLMKELAAPPETTKGSLDTTAAPVPEEPAVNKTEPASPEENQCHSYCMLNLDFYSKQAPLTNNVTNAPQIDVTIGKETVESQSLPTNDTNRNDTAIVTKLDSQTHSEATGNDLNGLITQSQFDCIFGELDSNIREKRWNGLKEAIELVPTFKPQNQNEIMIFLAHVAHESDGLKTLEEYCGQDRSCADNYQGGEGTWCTTTEVAPGKKYFGRGWFQLSWPCNYAEAGEALSADLLQDPDQVAQSDKLSCATALWYWHEKKMNEPAGRGDFGETTRILNSIECGAENEKQKARVQKYQNVRKCFNLSEETQNLIC